VSRFPDQTYGVGAPRHCRRYQISPPYKTRSARVDSLPPFVVCAAPGGQSSVGCQLAAWIRRITEIKYLSGIEMEGSSVTEWKLNEENIDGLDNELIINGIL